MGATVTGGGGPLLAVEVAIQLCTWVPQVAHLKLVNFTACHFHLNEDDFLKRNNHDELC